MLHPMTNCRDMSTWVSRSMDLRLSWGQRLAVRMHLMMCRHCRRLYEQLLSLRGFAQHEEADPSDDPARLSEDARGRIKSALFDHCDPSTT
jgi:anti-sigma factor ChrR (cupin superfamily)